MYLETKKTAFLLFVDNIKSVIKTCLTKILTVILIFAIANQFNCHQLKKMSTLKWGILRKDFFFKYVLIYSKASVNKDGDCKYLLTAWIYLYPHFLQKIRVYCCNPLFRPSVRLSVRLSRFTSPNCSYIL